MNSDRLNDKPSGETRQSVGDIRDNDVNDVKIDEICSNPSGDSRQGVDNRRSDEFC
jgi:hypothetical protein